MAKISITAFCLITLIGFRNTNGDIGEISGYPQVDVNELHPLTMSWNQVISQIRRISNCSLNITLSRLLKYFLICLGYSL